MAQYTRSRLTVHLTNGEGIVLAASIGRLLSLMQSASCHGIKYVDIKPIGEPRVLIRLDDISWVEDCTERAADSIRRKGV